METSTADQTSRPRLREVGVTVNGRSRRVVEDAGTSLLTSLRTTLDLTGAKASCEVGTCGTCTVLLDGDAVYSCLVLAAECDGRTVDTVEGLGSGDDLSALQQAFADCDGLQCGYCTPGQLMSLEALRRDDPEPDRAAIEAAVTGNLCRCGAYRHIIEAAEQAFSISSAAEVTS